MCFILDIETAANWLGVAFYYPRYVLDDCEDGLDFTMDARFLQLTWDNGRWFNRLLESTEP